MVLFLYGEIDSFHKLLEKKYVYEKMVELFESKVINDEDEKLNLYHF